MGVCILFQKDAESIQTPSGSGVLDVRAVFTHHAHLQGGRSSQVGCRLCEKGLASAVTEYPAAEEPKPVDAGDGVDEKRDAAPSPDPWGDER